MNTQPYLPEDNKKAISEYRQIWLSLGSLEETICINDLDEAKLAAGKLLDSIEKLEKLQEKKQRKDRNRDLVSRLSMKGVQIEMVVRSI
ncbi:hypothetical protein J7E55_12175 [Bacillus sp. ISL-53]|nr:hypothetical protein [Bacillus sp. ISL-53]